MAQKSLTSCDILLIGGSAGSLEVIIGLIPFFTADMPLAIVLVLHRRSGESVLAELLREKTTFKVQEVEEKDPIEPGTIYIAPADYHLLIEQNRTFSLDYSEKVNYSRPSIDVTFEAAAEVYQDKVAAMLLSGANADGTEGLKRIQENGGMTIVQLPSDASVSYMPQQALEELHPDYILDTAGLIDLIRGKGKQSLK
jgi:two-component system chemotaxis response regulator CheB